MLRFALPAALAVLFSSPTMAEPIYLVCTAKSGVAGQLAGIYPKGVKKTLEDAFGDLMLDGAPGMFPMLGAFEGTWILDREKKVLFEVGNEGFKIPLVKSSDTSVEAFYRHSENSKTTSTLALNLITGEFIESKYFDSSETKLWKDKYGTPLPLYLSRSAKCVRTQRAI